MDKLQPYCYGVNCPLKENCLRHKEDIDVKKEDYWPANLTPFNHTKNECEFFEADPVKKWQEEIDKLEPPGGDYCD